MSLDELLPEKYRGLAVYAAPPILGFTIDISAGMLMTLLTCLAAFIGQLTWRIGSGRARAHKEWIEAENVRVQPQLDRATRERDLLQARVARMESDLAESARAERDLALAILEQGGMLSPGKKVTP